MLAKESNIDLIGENDAEEEGGSEAEKAEFERGNLLKVLDLEVQDIVRIVSACCIRPSTAYLGVRAAIMCKIRECVLLRRRSVVPCHQSTIHSQSVFEAPGVLSGRARRAPRARNRP